MYYLLKSPSKPIYNLVKNDSLESTKFSDPFVTIYKSYCFLYKYSNIFL